MAAVPDGVSSRGRAGTNTRFADHLLPLLPGTGEPAATSRAFRGSSSRSSEEARRAADDEGMHKQVILADSAAGGHGGNYRRPSSSSGGGRAASPSRNHPASPPVSSRGGGYGRKNHGADDASSFVKPRVAVGRDRCGLAPEELTEELLLMQGSTSINLDQEDYGQERLSIRANFIQPSSAQKNIKQQAGSHTSLPERRGSIDATNRERPPKVSGEATEIEGLKYWQSDSVVPLFPSDGDFQNPDIMPKIITMTVNKPKTPKLLDYGQGSLSIRANFMKPSSAQQNIRQQAANHTTLPKRRDATNEERSSKVSAEATEIEGLKYWQSDSVVPPFPSDADFHKPEIMPNIIKMTINKPKTPKLLTCIFDEECLKEQSGRDSASEPSVNERATAANNRVQHSSVGHGDPHPPPFFKCEVCRSKTAFYQIKCCQLIVCEFCGCCCDPDDLEHKDKQSQVGQKETLPKVKLVGSDLFLWENFKFPAGLISGGAWLDSKGGPVQQ